MRQFYLTVIIYSLLAGLSGCAGIKETAKCVAGLSTKVLKDNRKDAIRKTFSYDYKACYDKAREILIGEEAYIYAQDINKHMIALYVSKQDTTPVGVFFKEIGPMSTEIEVSSPSKYAKEFIAQKLFPALEKLLNPKKEGYTHAKE